MFMSTQTIVVAKGDGIGPEIADAVLEILKAANVPLEYDFIEVGEKIFKSGNTAGITEEAWKKIHEHKVILKGPITTPQGGGYKSINVTMRKTLGLYANVRPCKSYVPFVPSFFPKMDMVIVRENEEDLYAGIEHRISNEVHQCLKLITRPGSEQIVRYAFEYAKAYGRKKVTCMTKDNIMKLADGTFRRIFEEIAKEYPDIQNDHMIIDIGAARIAAKPESFDVIVTLNLYGDIISDIAAEVAGSVGLAGSANIGRNYAMFEAIHGSAPDIAGKGIANPSGMLLAAVQMLVHLGLDNEASLIQNAWQKTLEDGIHTADIYSGERSSKKASTSEFAKAVIERLGQVPATTPAVKFKKGGLNLTVREQKKEVRKLVGVDLFLIWDEDGRSPEVLGKKLEPLAPQGLKLKMLSNRGLMVYPETQPGVLCCDSWRCRFMTENNQEIPFERVIDLLSNVSKSGFEVAKIENLILFDEKPYFSLAQGE